MTGGLGALRQELGQASWAAREFRRPSRWRTLRQVARGLRLPRLPRGARTGVWAVTMVRDEADIIAATVHHLLDQGVDHVLIADNRSTDATPDILRDLAKDPRVHLAYDAEPAYFQSEKMTALSHAAARAGAEWVIPFDADEFWLARGRSVADFLRGLPADVGVVKAAFHNMVKTDPDADLATARFVMDPVPHRPGKVAFRAHPLAIVSVGNHGVARVGAVTEGLFVAHAAYRSPAQVARKLRQGAAAVMLTRPGDTIARHWRAGGQLTDATTDEVWAAISTGASDERIGWHIAGDPVTVTPVSWRRWDPDDALGTTDAVDGTLPPPRRSVAVFVPMLHLRGGGEKHGLGVAAALSDAHDVTIYARRQADLGAVGEYFGLDLGRCSFALLPRPSLAERAAYRFHAPTEWAEMVGETALFHWFRGRGHTYFVNSDHRSRMSCPTPEGLFVCMFPRAYPDTRVTAFDRARAAAGLPAGLANPLSHPTIAANSDFTAGWVQRMWGRPVTGILYPPCVDMLSDGVRKRRIILSVGRFFPMGGDENDKRQDVLIDAFAELTDLHAQGWELHLAGSLADAPHHHAALDDLRARAAGLPVVFHPNIDFADLRRLYNEATFYWHATGFGTAVDADPARQEHFGITPVEAMSARAVPLVYGTAGPSDTVVDGISGRHWHTLDELRERTRALASDPARLATLADAARVRSLEFGWPAFSASVLALVDGGADADPPHDAGDRGAVRR